MMKKGNRFSKVLKTKNPLVLFSLFLFLLSGCGERQKPIDHEEYGENGKIAFLWYPEGRQKVGNLIMMDGNGNRNRYVGYFSGTPAFSQNGEQIAIACPSLDQNGLLDHSKTDICLLDIEKFISFTKYKSMDNYNNKYAISKRIPIPERCEQYQEWNGELYEGINSIDWSPNSDKLLLVCGDRNNSEVCIVDLDGNNICWDDEKKQDVFRAVWSPVDEKEILVSGWQYPPSKIYLATADGEIIEYLEPGWNAEWSSDGKKIAYIEYLEDPQTERHYYGIAVINKDGTDHQYYYLPEKGNKNSYLFLDGFDNGVPTRLAWSPSGQYIVISGTHLSLYNYGLFRLDTDTGEIISIVDTWIFPGILYEPDWGS